MEQTQKWARLKPQVLAAQMLYMVQANANDSVVGCTIPAGVGRMGLCVNMLFLLLDDTRLPWLNATLVNVVSPFCKRY